MNKNVAKNYLYNLLYQITAVLMPLITIPYVSRILKAEGIGINSYTSANLQYFILFGSLGIALYGNKTIAIVRDNKEKLKKTFWEIFSIQILGCIISYNVFYFILVRNSDLSGYYLLQSIAILSAGIDISWYFIGMEDFKKASLRSLFVKLLSVIFIFIFVKTENDLWKYIFINTAGALLGQLAMWIFLDKSFYNIKNIKGFNMPKHMKYILALFIPQIATQVYTVLDKTMIGKITNSVVEVGYYDQSQKIIRLSLTIVTSLGVVLLPRISNMYAHDKLDEIKIYLKNSFKVIILLAISIMFGIMAISRNFVPIFFGEGYDSVIGLIILSSIMILIIGAGNVFGTQYLLAIGKNREYTISVVCGAIINFVINITLIPRYGTYGAVIGTIFAELSITIIQIIYSREIVNLSWVKECINYLISGIMMYIATYYVGLIDINQKIILIIQVIVGVVIYCASLIILKDKLVIGYLKLFINKLKDKKKL